LFATIFAGLAGDILENAIMAKAQRDEVNIAGRRLKRFESAYGALLDVISSPKVKQFCVGITSNPSQRRSAYARWCREYDAKLAAFVILDWDYSSEIIISFERWLFERAKMSRKYANFKNVAYYPSVNRKYKSHHIYLAWWAPAFWN
jgi:hypothetical protein